MAERLRGASGMDRPRPHSRCSASARRTEQRWPSTVSISRSSRAASSGCSAATARARPPSCRSSPGSCRPDSGSGSGRGNRRRPRSAPGPRVHRARTAGDGRVPPAVGARQPPVLRRAVRPAGPGAATRIDEVAAALDARSPDGPVRPRALGRRTPALPHRDRGAAPARARSPRRADDRGRRADPTRTPAARPGVAGRGRGGRVLHALPARDRGARCRGRAHRPRSHHRPRRSRRARPPPRRERTRAVVRRRGAGMRRDSRTVGSSTRPSAIATDDPGATAARVLAALGADASTLASVEIIRPSLESVFTTVTGQRYGRDAESAA